MSKPVADLWFGVQALDGGLLRIRETHIDPYLAGNMWLVKGRDRALLIDSGTGLRPLRDTVAALAGVPVVAVALNCFYDHAGGLHEFDDRLAHRDDVAAIENPDGRSSVADDFVSDDMLLALPSAGYSTADYAMRPARITCALQDGDEIDLGDRRLEVIHTPGRTPGGICLWEAASRRLFTSDTLILGPAGETAPARDPEAYRKSLRRLAALPVAEVLPGHFEPFGRETFDRLVAGPAAA